jgi:hypothetical protein
VRTPAARAAGLPLPRATDPPMTEAEYQASLLALDTARQALQQEYITSQTYPRWAYHESEPSVIVDSDAEAVALGPDWSATPIMAPPVVTALEPAAAELGAPSFTLHVLGTGFDAASVIVFAGHDEPTTLVDDTVVTTGVDMAVWLGPDALPVLVRNGDGTESNALTFTFTEATP